jgi:hypothetical protein
MRRTDFTYPFKFSLQQYGGSRPLINLKIHCNNNNNNINNNKFLTPSLLSPKSGCGLISQFSAAL